MTSKKKKRHVPTKRVDCDLQIEGEDGEVWLDRSGQWVEYRAAIRWGMMKRIVALSGDIESKEQLEDIDGVLRHIVLDWNWDDEFGDPLPHPSSAGAFDDLETDEVFWLIENTPGIAEGPKSRSE
jgi:hypothetical protein